MNILFITVNEKPMKEGYESLEQIVAACSVQLTCRIFHAITSLPPSACLPPKLSPKETPLSPESKTHNINIAANRAPRRAAAGPNARAAPPVNRDGEPPVNVDGEPEPEGENGLDEDRRVPEELRLEGMELTTVVVGNGGKTVEWVAVEDAGRLL